MVKKKSLSSERRAKFKKLKQHSKKRVRSAERLWQRGHVLKSLSTYEAAAIRRKKKCRCKGKCRCHFRKKLSSRSRLKMQSPKRRKYTVPVGWPAERGVDLQLSVPRKYSTKEAHNHYLRAVNTQMDALRNMRYPQYLLSSGEKARRRKNLPIFIELSGRQYTDLINMPYYENIEDYLVWANELERKRNEKLKRAKFLGLSVDDICDSSTDGSSLYSLSPPRRGRTFSAFTPSPKRTSKQK